MRRVVIGGASGMIGRALATALRARGAQVLRLVRRPATGPDEARWDPETGALDPTVFDGADAVVNLSGRSIAAARWTARVRSEILESRVRATRLLVDTIEKAHVRPAVLVSASAIGYYGDRGDEVLSESAPPGRGFLVEVVQAWEAEAQRAAASGVRVVCTRFGLVLARDGGTMRPLLPIFRLGLGGPMGSGRQWWSWVHLDDLLAAIIAAIEHRALEGPINVVAPQPVQNVTFARTLGAVLRRPAVLPAPAFALRLMMGAMADEMILAGQRVTPGKLQAQGFAFRWLELRPALENLVERRKGDGDA